MSTKAYTTDAVVPATAYDGRDKVQPKLLYEQLGWLRAAMATDAPAIAPGLYVESEGIGADQTAYLMVDMYRTDPDANTVPYDERYVRVGELSVRPSDAAMWEIDPEYGTDSWDSPILACEETIGIVVECVAHAIASLTGAGARVVPDVHGHATVALDATDATAAPITHGALPITISALRDDARTLTAAAVADSLMACHPDAAAQTNTDAWPEITLYARDGESILASVDYSQDHDDAVVLTGPDGRSYVIWTGEHEPVSWQDEDDIVRPVCDAVRAALDADAA
jgi:hypothetical protein